MKGPVTQNPQTALRREQYPCGLPTIKKPAPLASHPREPDPRAQKPASHKAVITVMTGPGIPKLQTIVFLRKPLAGFGI